MERLPEGKVHVILGGEKKMLFIEELNKVQHEWRGE